MIAFLDLYRWTLVSGGLMGAVLALLGTQLAARDKAMQTVCIGQGASVGVLIGIGIVESLFTSEWANAIGPLATAFIASSLTYFVSEKLGNKRMASKNTFFAFLFGLLIAVGYMIAALSPHLETHMSQIYFGDLSTLGSFDAGFCIVMGSVALLFLGLFYKHNSNDSFEMAMFGDMASTPVRSRFLFNLCEVLVICFSVQYLGFLFTVTSLFLPTALLTSTRTKGLKFHLISCAMLATVSTGAGFVLSLYIPRLPTVPTIVMTMFFLGGVFLGVERVISHMKRRPEPIAAWKSEPRSP